MSDKYGYNRADAEHAGARTAESLNALTAQLKAQHARGSRYFVGDGLTALDVYWTSFMNLLSPLPKEQCPMPEDWRPAFVATDPQITAALDPVLIAHRDQIFKDHFRCPMEF